MTALLHIFRVLAGRTYVPLVCDTNADHQRAWLSSTETVAVAWNRHLPCRCGGHLVPTYRTGGS